MKLTVDSNTFLKALQTVAPAIGSNPILPILENFLLVLEDGKLTISATDLENSIVTSVDVVGQNGSIAIPAKILLDTLKELPQQPITIAVSNTNGVTITSAQGKYKLNGESGKDYPNIPTIDDGQSIDLLIPEFVNVLDRTLFAVSNDELRPAMTGMYMKPGTGSIEFCCTDAHKLSLQTIDAKCGADDALIIPGHTLRKLKSVLPKSGALSITYNASHIIFKIDNVRFTGRIVDARYPDFKAVIPVDNPNTLTVSKSAITGALKRVAIFANKTTNQVILNIGKTFEISAQDLDVSNEALEQLDFEHDGEPLTIGFNAKFLLEMLNACEGETVKFNLNTPTRAGILTDDVDGSVFLLMPVMLYETAEA